MQTFYLLIGKNQLFLYQKKDSKYTRQYIEGNPAFQYELNNANHDMDRLLDLLVNECNLNTRAELEFIVIGNEDPICSEVMKRNLEGFILEWHEIDTILQTALTLYSNRDKKRMIKEWGINFDGKNYKLEKNQVSKEKFSLLGYTLEEDAVLNFLK